MEGIPIMAKRDPFEPSTGFYREHTLEGLAAQQGTHPIDFKQLMAEPDFWPTEETIEDFMAFLDEVRGRKPSPNH
jgi:hypothetical protein